MLTAGLHAQPANLARLVAERESAAIEARANYTYRQTVVFEEIGRNGAKAGEYREVREVIFLASGERSERIVSGPHNTLRRLRLTEEDFRDVREVQPFLFTKDLLWLYDVRPRGDEKLDGVDCWVLTVKPKQVFEGQRLFEGEMWIDKSDLTIVQSFGKAVPDIRRKKEENLFPRFTTYREKIDGHRFPVRTYSDDVLEFSSGPLRQRMSIHYSNYKKFDASSTVRFDEKEAKRRTGPPKPGSFLARQDVSQELLHTLERRLEPWRPVEKTVSRAIGGEDLGTYTSFFQRVHHIDRLLVGNGLVRRAVEKQSGR